MQSHQTQPIEIRRAAPEEVVDLRHAVLRQGLPRLEAIFPGDDLPTSRHYGAFVRASAPRAVGCATIHLSQWEGEPAWQLRGMATDPEYRRHGLGRAMLVLMESDLRSEPSLPKLLWCNARVPALAFYRTMGWDIVSEQFEIPTAGPHRRMVKRLSPTAGI